MFTLLFADDTSFLISGKNLNEIITKLNVELKKVADWFRANELSLNPEKTKFMIFNKNHDSIQWDEIDIYLDFNNSNQNNTNLKSKLEYVNKYSPNPTIKFLGLYLDSELSFKFHIKEVQNKMSKSLYILRQVSKFLCKDSLKSLYFSFIHSHLLYCLPIWSCTAKCNLEGVIRIQKKAIRIISGSRYNAHTANLFKQLEILPLEQLILFTKLNFMYDYLNEKLPKSFANTWNRNNDLNRRTIRNGNLLNVPFGRNETIKRYPYFNFPIIWNQNCENDLLNAEIRRGPFLKTLKTFLFLDVETNCNNIHCHECIN